MVARWLLFAGVVACHTTATSAALDASVVDASVSPCTTTLARAPDMLDQPALHALVLTCTGQTPEAAEPVKKTLPFGSGSILVYTQTLAADGGKSVVLAEIDSPPRMIAWTTLPLDRQTFGTSGPSLRARFDTLRGETVIVESLREPQFRPYALSSINWERVWLRRGHDLVLAGRYSLNGETDTGATPSGPVRSFDAKTIFHGDRIEIREDVTWSWYRLSYSDIDGEQRSLLASVHTTYEHALVLRGDALEPDSPPEITPTQPNKKSP